MSYELSSIRDAPKGALRDAEDVERAIVVPHHESDTQQLKGSEDLSPRKVRNQAIDLVRGMAIVVMLQANITPYVNHFEHPHIVLRLIYSMAAPIFIFLSGYSACAFHKKVPDPSSVVGWCSMVFNFNVQRVWFAAV